MPSDFIDPATGRCKRCEVRLDPSTGSTFVMASLAHMAGHRSW